MSEKKIEDAYLPELMTPMSIDTFNDNRPEDRGECLESHFFFIPCILTYEGNGKKRLFWLRKLNVRFKYFYTYVDELGWVEERKMISVPVSEYTYV